MPRITSQRRAILQVLKHAPHHPDAAWIYLEARKLLPNLSQATVYRQLDTLVSEGLIRIVPNAGGPQRYDANLEPHHHLLEPSGDLVDIDVDLQTELAHMLSKVRKAHPELEVRDVVLRFVGERKSLV